MKSLKFTSVVLALVLSQAAGANVLYSWKHKDGTPTFSPDPPPKGVPYVIVGPDLKPIPQPLPGLQQDNDQGNSQSPPVAQENVPLPSTNPTSAAPVKSASDVVMTPAPGSIDSTPAQPAAAASTPAPATDWKPVRYADDPNPGNNSTATKAPTSEIVPTDNRISAACLDMKQQLLVLESKFANAVSAADMDTAIVGINSFRKANKGLCGL